MKNMIQSTGKKSFARCAEELRDYLGYEPTRVERFMKFYSKKDGTPSNDNSAEVMAKMSEEIAHLPDGENDKVGPDDIFAKVMGKDKDGRARMFGLGVSTSDLWSQIPNRSKSYRISATLQGTMEEMQKTLKDQSRKLAELESKLSLNEGNEVSGASVPSASTHRLAVQTTSTHEPRTLRVGSSVYLKSIVSPSVTIARGRIPSLNPLDEVAGEELGPNWCEVHIEVPIKRGEHLIRPYSFFKMIEDAVGATIAWPCPFTEVVGVDDD